MKSLKTQPKLLFYLTLAVLFTSCATPKPVVRMNPVSENVKWNYGQAYASDTVNGVVVEAAFDKSTPEYNVFDVSVINNSNMEFLVDPASFRFEDVTTDPVNPGIIKATDPEEVLLDIDKRISKDEADAKNAKVGGAILAGALVATSVAIAVSDANDDHHHHHREADPNLLVSAPIIIDGSNNYVPGDYVSSIERQREMWETSTIRKTSLEPGYKIEGKVFFPKFVSPGYYNFIVPVDEGRIEIQFLQLNFLPGQ